MEISKKIRDNTNKLYVDLDASFRDECLHKDVSKDMYYRRKVRNIILAVLKKIEKTSQD